MLIGSVKLQACDDFEDVPKWCRMNYLVVKGMEEFFNAKEELLDNYDENIKTTKYFLNDCPII